MSVFDDVTCSDLEGLIGEWIHNERDRAILKRRLVDGIVYEKLAEEFAISVTQTKNIVYSGQKKILRHL